MFDPTALLSCLLSLLGWLGGGDLYITRLAGNGEDALYSRTRVVADLVRFECIRSRSGQCYYTVFPQQCPPGAKARDNAACTPGAAERFSLPAGTRREVIGAAGFDLCVSEQDEILTRDCKPR